MSEEKLVGIRLKIERAKQHFGDAEHALSIFSESGPYKIGTKHDPETRELIYYAKEVNSIPPIVAVLAGETINCLRSALDHLAVQLVLASPGGAAADIRKIQFPITPASNRGKTPRERKIEGMGQNIIDAIDVLEPYKGGAGNDLWILHELNNIDKHRLLVSAASVLQSVDHRPTQWMRDLFAANAKPLPTTPMFFGPANDIFRPLKAGDVLLVDAVPDAKPTEEIQFRIQESFYEPGVIECEPLLYTLSKFYNLVNGIVDQFARFV